MTIGAAASELGITQVKAIPRLVKVAAPRSIVSKNVTIELGGNVTLKASSAIKAMMTANAKDIMVLWAILPSINIINGKGVPRYRLSTPISLLRVRVMAIPV